MAVPLRPYSQQSVIAKRVVRGANTTGNRRVGIVLRHVANRVPRRRVSCRRITRRRVVSRRVTGIVTRIRVTCVGISRVRVTLVGVPIPVDIAVRVVRVVIVVHAVAVHIRTILSACGKQQQTQNHKNSFQHHKLPYRKTRNTAAAKA